MLKQRGEKKDKKLEEESIFSRDLCTETENENDKKEESEDWNHMCILDGEHGKHAPFPRFSNKRAREENLEQNINVVSHPPPRKKRKRLPNATQAENFQHVVRLRARNNSRKSQTNILAEAKTSTNSRKNKMPDESTVYGKNPSHISTEEEKRRRAATEEMKILLEKIRNDEPSEDESLDEDDAAGKFVCSICGLSDVKNKMFLLCDALHGEPEEHGCHLQCVNLKVIPEGDWCCPKHNKPPPENPTVESNVNFNEEKKKVVMCMDKQKCTTKYIGRRKNITRKLKKQNIIIATTYSEKKEEKAICGENIMQIEDVEEIMICVDEEESDSSGEIDIVELRQNEDTGEFEEMESNDLDSDSEIEIIELGSNLEETLTYQFPSCSPIAISYYPQPDPKPEYEIIEPLPHIKLQRPTSLLITKKKLTTKTTKNNIPIIKKRKLEEEEEQILNVSFQLREIQMNKKIRPVVDKKKRGRKKRKPNLNSIIQKHNNQNKKKYCKNKTNPEVEHKIVLKRLISIKERCLSRRMKSQNSYPLNRNSKNLTHDEQLEKSDYHYLKRFKNRKLSPEAQTVSKQILDMKKTKKSLQEEANWITLLMGIKNRCLQRKDQGRSNIYPQEKDGKTQEEIIENNDLRNLNRARYVMKSRFKENESKLFEEIESWYVDKAEKKLEILQEIRNRCLLRQENGKQKYPRTLSFPTNEEEKQERIDTNFLIKFSKSNRKPTKAQKKLLNEIHNWKPKKRRNSHTPQPGSKIRKFKQTRVKKKKKR